MIRNTTQWPQLALRPVLGLGLIYHGAPMLFTASGHANYVHMLHEIGFPWAELNAWLIAGLECACGLAILLGAFTVFFAVLAALELGSRILAIALIGRGFPAPLPGEPPLPGYETSLLYIGLLLALVIAGAGLLSIDRRRHPPQRPPVGQRYGR